MEIPPKKISIITTCYNVYEYLPRCVDSLLNQTIGLENLELIFIDDASTDQTLQYLKELEQRYPQNIIVIINEQNQRMGIARNTCMQYASGKYIGFVDADDWVLPEMYETLYQKAEQYQCDITSSRLVRVTQEGMIARGRIEPEENDSFFCIETEEQRKNLLAGGMTVFDTVNVVTKLYRREFIVENQIHFGEHYAFEDLYFSDLATYYVKRFAVIQGEYYHYFVHDHSIMNSMDAGRWFDQRKVMIEWLEVCQQRGLLDRYYQETELIFAKDYYISNLHFILTRTDIGQAEYDYIESCRKITWNLFPEIAENPYFDQQEYFHTFQRPLMEHIKVSFRRGELQKIQKQYCDTLLSMVGGKKELTKTQPEQKPKNSQTLHIMIAADKNYLYPSLVFLVSLFHNHRNHKVIVYFLQSGFSAPEQQLFWNLAEKMGGEIHCINITEKYLQGLKGFGRFSVAAFYRILGMDMIPEHVKRILYLDVDMVVNKDLSELFSLNLDYPLAACYDINNALQGNIEYHKSVIGISNKIEQSYFNSGMLVMDMEYIRKHHVKDILLKDILKNFEIYSLVDQDALNRYYAGRTLYLPWQKYNCPCVPFLSTEHTDLSSESLLSYQEVRNLPEEKCNGFDITNQMIQEASVIHFCTSQKPWRDREFYRKENMAAARTIYERYERLLQRILPEAKQH
ncbi:MAG: glycosyltransferase [Ruminococcus flavefaciens]|nr:glycosyltransferase [Ruminococcus flavefaciens]